MEIEQYSKTDDCDIDSYQNEGKYNMQHTEEEHSQLISSLNSITTHFAHVQFRLRQVIDAPLEQKETLLEDLEEFTFKGVPDFHVTPGTSSEEASIQMKDQLIIQLKTQISELEKSLSYLQKKSASNTTGTAKVEGHHENIVSKYNSTPQCGSEDTGNKIFSSQLTFIRKLLSILHIVNKQCNKEENSTIKQDLQKNKPKINHWGDGRAKLEIAIADVIELAGEPSVPIDSDYMSDSDGSSYNNNCNQKLASVVRRQLAPAIQSLMQHGLISESKSVSVANSFHIVIGCVAHPSSGGAQKIDHNAHAWEFILRYYHMKNGDQFISSPALKLSQSFNLEVVGGGNLAKSNVQKLLVTIGNIISTHSKYKRSYNAQFKAFICAGLNFKLLPNWLQLIYKSKELVEMYYEPWSYTFKMGFDDCCASLEKLNQIHFDLPVDMAVHGLQNIKDAF